MKGRKFYILFLIPLFTTCLESPDMTTGIVNGKEKPTVVTLSRNPIPSDGVLMFQGEIISEGKSGITERGFYWSTVSNDPGINDNVATASNAATEVFTYELKEASGGKTYYWRAYARNSFGYEYGEVRTCVTPSIWIEKLQFPDDRRGRGVIFEIADRIYMTCGSKFWSLSAFVDDTWEYNTVTDRWNRADSISFPGNTRNYPVVFTIGNLAFVGTGSRTTY
jgi:hypothetical protein